MSTLNARILVQIRNISCFLAIRVVPDKLPLLVSVKSLDKMGAIIDTVRINVTFESLVTFISSARYVVFWPFGIASPTQKQDFLSSEIFVARSETLDEMQILKVHKQLAHCRTDCLKSFRQNAGCDVDISVIEKVLSKCDI